MWQPHVENSTLPTSAARLTHHYVFTTTYSVSDMTIQDINIFQQTVDAAIERKGRKVRKESAYSVGERAVLAKYKDDYVQLLRTEDRASYIRQHILPDIFNHWYKLGEIGTIVSADDASERIKVRKRR
jgi:hypothetical protein